MERFLGKTREEIYHIAKETLEGYLRGVLATLIDAACGYTGVWRPAGEPRGTHRSSGVKTTTLRPSR